MTKIFITFLGTLCVGSIIWYQTNSSRPKSSKPVSKFEPVSSPAIDAPIQEVGLTGVEPESSLEKKMRHRILLRFHAGDYHAALSLTDNALNDRNVSGEFSQWLRQQLPAILNAAGWLDIKMGKCAKAIPLFTRSQNLLRTVIAAKGLAVCYHKLKRFRDAKEQFFYYLKGKPKDSQMRLLYVDLLESLLEYNQAADQLSLLIDLDPENKSLQQRLRSMRAKAKEGYNQITATSQHINLTYRAEEHENLVNFVLQTCEEAIFDFVESYNFRPPQRLIEIVLYPADQFSHLIHGSPNWAQGIFDGRLRIPIIPKYLESRQPSELKRVLKHELVHALLAYMTDFRPVPTWFNEGLAQRLECDNCRSRFFPPTPGDFLEPKSFSASYVKLSALQAERSYRQSLYLVHTLENYPSLVGGAPLRKVIAAINPSSKLSSDGILASVKISFSDLHSRAARLWQQRYQF